MQYLFAHADSCHTLVTVLTRVQIHLSWQEMFWYRNEARQMFFDGYDNYLQFAFPKVVGTLENKACTF